MHPLSANVYSAAGFTVSVPVADSDSDVNRDIFLSVQNTAMEPLAEISQPLKASPGLVNHFSTWNPLAVSFWFPLNFLR